MPPQDQIFKYLDFISQIIPATLYILNLNSQFIIINERGVKAVGAPNKEFVIGKNVFELYKDDAIASALQNDIDQVIQRGEIIQTEDKIVDVNTGKFRYYTATKAPLYDLDNQLIGIVGTSIKVTDQKNILHYLKLLAPLIPGNIYWKNLNSEYLGMNEVTLQASGLGSFSNFIGKTDYELWPQFADQLVSHDREVIQTGNVVAKEEAITLPNGKFRYFTVVKVPLRDDENNIVGIVGNSIDITAQKEAEQAKAANEARFRKVVGQMVHDVQSPLTVLFGLIDELKEQIPEVERNILREVASRIAGITSHMLDNYRSQSISEESNSGDVDIWNAQGYADNKQAVLVSASLLNFLGEKNYEYKDRGIVFSHDFADDVRSAFILVNPVSFKRAISNLLNNAVDALRSISNSEIVLKLENKDNSVVVISVIDNGSGMSAELVNKIKANLAVSHGKSNGHGLGLTQVRDMLEQSSAKFELNSVVGHGTTISLEFPRIATPEWLAEEIEIKPDAIMIILDDDPSIHSAWDRRLADKIQTLSSLTVMHFTSGAEVISFVNQLPADKHDKVCLLSDYELLNQSMNGLEVIKATGIAKAILVTSHYDSPEICKLAIKQGVKILPKGFVSYFLIKSKTVKI